MFLIFFFFFKQKTAYEMRISDWSSDVCSSDLRRAAVLAGPAAITALIAGWIVTEVGRQPWIIYGVVRVDDAVTDAGWIWWSLATIVVVYGSMTAFGVVVLRAMSRRWRKGEEMRVPNGPGADENRKRGE